MSDKKQKIDPAFLPDQDALGPAPEIVHEEEKAKEDTRFVLRFQHPLESSILNILASLASGEEEDIAGACQTAAGMLKSEGFHLSWEPVETVDGKPQPHTEFLDSEGNTRPTGRALERLSKEDLAKFVEVPALPAGAMFWKNNPRGEIAQNAKPGQMGAVCATWKGREHWVNGKKEFLPPLITGYIMAEAQRRYWASIGFVHPLAKGASKQATEAIPAGSSKKSPLGKEVEVKR